MLKDDLQRMRTLLADPQCWTQGACGRDAKGHQLTVPHPEVTCWCLMGAAIQTIGHDITDEIDDHLNDSPLLEGISYIRFNDTHTHAEVLALLDERINALPA